MTPSAGSSGDGTMSQEFTRGASNMVKLHTQAFCGSARSVFDRRPLGLEPLQPIRARV